ncbi:hypothetical protein ABZ135_23575 [Streptomyces sp. NPDC006339]|uniref:hypothetical protein n=1 Tax=Streptomyces sp. NPDC006339 TaxID=3156755 RepID=UPI00339F99B4
MPASASNASCASTAPGGTPPQLAFLLTTKQGEAARALLDYVAALPLPGPDAQLLAAVVAIRAARGGVGNITGQDLASLRLGDAHEAVNALRGLGWQLTDTVFGTDPTAPPTPVTVPELTRNDDHPLPLGKLTRSRVSGWTTKSLSAKPVKKLPPAARLAGLFLAAHATSRLLGSLPPQLPAACRAELPKLMEKGFLAELSGDRYRLDPQVRHLSGLRPPTEEERARTGAPAKPARGFRFDPDAWLRWKQAATPGLQRHVESIETCGLCGLAPERVAEAFTTPSRAQFMSKQTRTLYGQWKTEHPDHGPQAAAFTVAFRAEHGHGPSFRQVAEGMGWNLPYQLRWFIVQRLLANNWLTSTGTVPWTLRPGTAAQEQGITLPRARTAPVAAQRS